MNCPNCNAPVRGSMCEYCGTHFGLDMGDPNGDIGKNIVIPLNITAEQAEEAIRAWHNTVFGGYKNEQK